MKPAVDRPPVFLWQLERTSYQRPCDRNPCRPPPAEAGKEICNYAIGATCARLRAVDDAEIVDFALEVLEVSELAVNRRETNVGDMIDLLELLKHSLANGR